MLRGVGEAAPVALPGRMIVVDCEATSRKLLSISANLWKGALQRVEFSLAKLASKSITRKKIPAHVLILQTSTSSAARDHFAESPAKVCPGRSASLDNEGEKCRLTLSRFLCCPFTRQLAALF